MQLLSFRAYHTAYYRDLWSLIIQVARAWGASRNFVLRLKLSTKAHRSRAPDEETTSWRTLEHRLRYPLITQRMYFLILFWGPLWGLTCVSRISYENVMQSHTHTHTSLLPLINLHVWIHTSHTIRCHGCFF